VGQSEEVRLARAQVEFARAQVRGARSAALPQLDANLAYTRTFASPFQVSAPALPDSLRFDPDPGAPLEERVRYLEQRVPTAGLAGLGALFGNLPFGQENAYSFAISGSQPLYAGGRVGAALDIAEEFQEAARLGLREQLAEIELQVRNAYYRARLAQELETIAAAAVQQAERFLAEGLIRDVADIYELDAERLARLEGFGEVSARNLEQAIERSKRQPFSRVLFALGIPHVGGITAQLLADEFGSIDALADATQEDIAAVEGIGPVIAEAVSSWFLDEEHQEVVAKARGRPVENKVVGIRIDDPAPDFARIAAGFGVHAEGPIDTADAVGPALRRALRVVKDGRPALVDVLTRP
jgi:hypothetical protein